MTHIAVYLCRSTSLVEVELESFQLDSFVFKQNERKKKPAPA